MPFLPLVGVGTGTDGESAYQIAVRNGFVGNEAAWLASLQGDAGSNGTGDVTGPASSVDAEIALFSLTTGKLLKRATGTGVAVVAAGVFSTVTAPTGNIVGHNDQQTLSNKRINRRVVSTASTGTPTPDVSTTDVYSLTALAANATFGVPIGTPTDGNVLLIRIKDNGTTRTLSWNAIYRAIGLTLPTATVANKTLYVGAVYNAADTKWDVIATGQEA